MNYVRSNSLSLKYQGFPPLGCQVKRIGKFSLWQKLNSFVIKYVYCAINISFMKHKTKKFKR